MDFQLGFNIAVGLLAFLGGWVMNNLRDSLKSLHAADAATVLADRRICALILKQQAGMLMEVMPNI